MIACIAVLMVRDAFDETQQELGALWRWLPLGASMTLFIFVYGFFLMNVSMCAAARAHTPSEASLSRDQSRAEKMPHPTPLSHPSHAHLPATTAARTRRRTRA